VRARVLPIPPKESSCVLVWLTCVKPAPAVLCSDIVRRVLLEDRVPGKVKASAIMTKGPATVDASKTILQTMKQFMDWYVALWLYSFGHGSLCDN